MFGTHSKHSGRHVRATPLASPLPPGAVTCVRDAKRNRGARHSVRTRRRTDLNRLRTGLMGLGHANTGAHARRGAVMLAGMTETARLYRILRKTSPPTVQFVGEVRDSVVFWIGLSEDGREKVMAAGRDSVVYGASGTRHVIQKCNVRWSRPNFSALPGQQFDDSTSARFVVQAQPSSPSPAQGCDIANEDGAGTIAPRIAGRSYATMTTPFGPTRFTKSRRGTPALQPR